jgi:hypothetical protein
VIFAGVTSFVLSGNRENESISQEIERTTSALISKCGEFKYVDGSVDDSIDYFHDKYRWTFKACGKSWSEYESAVGHLYREIKNQQDVYCNQNNQAAWSCGRPTFKNETSGDFSKWLNSRVFAVRGALNRNGHIDSDTFYKLLRNSGLISEYAQIYIKVAMNQQDDDFSHIWITGIRADYELARRK